jgi:hypothetical protein
MPPSARGFVNFCRQEFRYLEDDYGFTAGPLVFCGHRDRFGVCFQGPKLAIVVQGIQWGSAIQVCLKTGDVEAQPEWAAEMDRMRAAISREEKRQPGEDPATVRRRLDELRLRFELPIDWLFDQRLPGWRSRTPEHGQLTQIHDYAEMLRSCAGDLLSGDLNAMPDLFASFTEHRRQEEILVRQEFSDLLAQSAQRPRTVLEEEIVGKVHNLIRSLHAECRLLLKTLGKVPESASLNRFAESWRSLAARLEAEIAEFSRFRHSEAPAAIVKGLQSAREITIQVEATLASGQADSALIERLTVLDQVYQEINLALGALLHTRQEEVATRYPQPAGLARIRGAVRGYLWRLLRLLAKRPS